MQDGRAADARALLGRLRGLAARGNFAELVALARQLFAEDQSSEVSLEAGALLAGSGLLTHARTFIERARQMDPSDADALLSLASVERDSGNHALARRLYAQVLAQHPFDAVARRSAVTSLEYDPDVTGEDCQRQARAWGGWAVAAAGGRRERPPTRPLSGRALRVGYLSADFCQHTVGLFVKDVLEMHDRRRVELFAYGAGRVNDWVTEIVRRTCNYRDVARLPDEALAAQIREDEIDVLIDLSGHTGGSRLTVFAHRPAPLQVSWLGYFATTGLDTMDAVLLDEWHAPPGTESHFVEDIVRLRHGRFCYQPVPWAPAEVARLPSTRNGCITFGCFNNTAKLNAGVFDVWARILGAVPDSRLVLKWRSFNDEGLRTRVTAAFVERGISPDRIEPRGPSFHADLLKEYADIDIGLDPFPFTGGLTSCEALWMGVPVVTWPQSRVVSRQTFAFLSAIGLPDLAATSADDYVRIAAGLAGDRERLQQLRQGLRERMLSSPLMDVTGFTRELEDTLTHLYQSMEGAGSDPTAKVRTVLHVGPGHRSNGAQLPAALRAPAWREVRLDIDARNEPDIVGSMLDMRAVADASVDAVYSAHNIEHVYPHEVPIVLKEWFRVLTPEGFLVVTCPDLQSVCALVVEDRLTEPAYQSPAGPITPLDILYGHGAALAAGHLHMAHKGGFTLRALTTALRSAGFATVAGKRRAHALDLWAVATKTVVTETEVRQLAAGLLPP